VSKAGTASITMTGSEAETFRTLVEMAIFLLMTLTTTHEAGIIESRMR